VRNILLEGNRLKKNLCAAKSKMKTSWSRIPEINMCPNFYMLYSLGNTDLIKCKTYGHARYKPWTGKGRIVVAYRKLRYFSITHRLQILFMSSKIVEYMTWYHSHDMVDEVVMHPSDGEAWKQFNRVHSKFFNEASECICWNMYRWIQLI
jgi:hypothetical protein